MPLSHKRRHMTGVAIWLEFIGILVLILINGLFALQ